jgi:hypothetical protein
MKLLIHGFLVVGIIFSMYAALNSSGTAEMTFANEKFQELKLREKTNYLSLDDENVKQIMRQGKVVAKESFRERFLINTSIVIVIYILMLLMARKFRRSERSRSRTSTHY